MVGCSPSPCPCGLWRTVLCPLCLHARVESSRQWGWGAAASPGAAAVQAATSETILVCCICPRCSPSCSSTQPSCPASRATRWPAAWCAPLPAPPPHPAPALPWPAVAAAAAVPAPELHPHATNTRLMGEICMPPRCRRPAGHRGGGLPRHAAAHHAHARVHLGRALACRSGLCSGSVPRPARSVRSGRRALWVSVGLVESVRRAQEQA